MSISIEIDKIDNIYIFTIIECNEASLFFTFSEMNVVECDIEFKIVNKDLECKIDYDSVLIVSGPLEFSYAMSKKEYKRIKEKMNYYFSE